MTGKHTFDESDDSNAKSAATEELPSPEEQRAEVAETVAALAAKADVSTRVQNEASFQADRAKAITQENPQMVAAAVGGVIAALFVTALLRRRRRRSKRIVVL